MAGLIQPVLPMIEYFTFKQSIIEFLCEERNNPYSDCEGMCYLKSQIEEQQNNEEQQALLKLDERLTLQLPLSYHIFILDVNKEADLPQLSKKLSMGISFEIFHPPKS